MTVTQRKPERGIFAKKPATEVSILRKCVLPKNDTEKPILIECGRPIGVVRLPVGSTGLSRKENGPETTEHIVATTSDGIGRNIGNV